MIGTVLLLAVSLWQEQLAQGKAAMSARSFAEARTHFESAARLNPNSAEAFFYLGMSALKLGERDAAEQAWRHALKIEPSAPPALYNLGVLLLDESRPVEAIGLFEKVRGRGGMSTELAANLVRANLEAKRNVAAMAVLAAADKQFEREPAFHAVAGQLLLDHNLLAAACREFGSANQLVPGRPEIALPMAMACLETHDPAAAAAALDSVREPPERADQLLQMARLYQKLGEQRKASGLLEKARAADPSLADVPYSMAVSYIAADDEAQAIRLLEEALKLNPTFDRAQFFLGTIHLSALRLEQADPLLAAALKEKPDNPFYACFVGLLRVNQGRFDEAERGAGQG